MTELLKNSLFSSQKKRDRYSYNESNDPGAPDAQKRLEPAAVGRFGTCWYVSINAGNRWRGPLITVVRNYRASRLNVAVAGFAPGGVTDTSTFQPPSMEGLATNAYSFPFSRGSVVKSIGAMPGIGGI